MGTDDGVPEGVRGESLTLAEFARMMERATALVPVLPRQVIEALEATVRGGGTVYKWTVAVPFQESYYRDGDTCFMALSMQGKVLAMWIQDRGGNFVEQVKPIRTDGIVIP